MPHSNLGEREYVMLDDLEANVEEEKDDIVNDITELSKEHKKTHGPLSGNSSSSGVSGARRRLSLSGRGSSFPFLSSRQSTSSLLEHVLMKNGEKPIVFPGIAKVKERFRRDFLSLFAVSRSPSFNTSSGGFFPYPQSAPSFSRLHIPWLAFCVSFLTFVFYNKEFFFFLAKGRPPVHLATVGRPTYFVVWPWHFAAMALRYIGQNTEYRKLHKSLGCPYPYSVYPQP